MRIDAHLHFWHYDPADYGWITDAMPALKQDRLPADVEPLLAENGFDGGIAVQARQTEAETEFLLQLAADNDFIKGVVGWVDLQSTDLEDRLRHYAQFPVLKGFRHIVQDEPDEEFLLRPAFIEGVKKLDKFNFTYDILVYEKHLPVVLHFLDQFDDQPFVLDHIGKPDMKRPMSEQWKEYLYALADYPNLYCKVSGLVTEARWHEWRQEDIVPFLEVAFDAFGAERILVGSDWPVCLLAAPDYRSVIQVVKDFIGDFSDAEKRMVFGENAFRFYRLE